MYCDLTNQWLEVSGSNCRSMSGWSLIAWCGVTIRLQQHVHHSYWAGEKQEALSRFLSNIYQDGRWRNLTGACWLFISKRRKRDISLSFSYGRVSPWPASVGINQIIKLNFRSWDLSSRQTGNGPAGLVDFPGGMKVWDTWSIFHIGCMSDLLGLVSNVPVNWTNTNSI